MCHPEHMQQPRCAGLGMLSLRPHVSSSVLIVSSEGLALLFFPIIWNITVDKRYTHREREKQLAQFRALPTLPTVQDRPVLSGFILHEVFGELEVLEGGATGWQHARQRPFLAADTPSVKSLGLVACSIFYSARWWKNDRYYHAKAQQQLHLSTCTLRNISTSTLGTTQRIARHKTFSLKACNGLDL